MEHIEALWAALLDAVGNAREFTTLRDLETYRVLAQASGDTPIVAMLGAIERHLIEGDVREGRDAIAEAMLPLIEALEA